MGLVPGRHPNSGPTALVPSARREGHAPWSSPCPRRGLHPRDACRNWMHERPIMSDPSPSSGPGQRAGLPIAYALLLVPEGQRGKPLPRWWTRAAKLSLREAGPACSRHPELQPEAGQGLEACVCGWGQGYFKLPTLSPQTSASGDPPRLPGPRLWPGGVCPIQTLPTSWTL